MSLLSKEKALIENDYFQVWEIVEMLSKGGFNLWEEVGEFLGHHNFDTELTLYCRDSFHRMHEVRNDYAPIRNLIHGLHVAWLEGEESIQKIKIDIIGYYWAKHEIYNFKPIMDLGIIEGFNEQIAEPLYKEPTQAYAEFEKINASLELDLAIEKNKVEKLNEEIDNLKAEIAKWEASQAVQQDCLLSQIFDESATERYAPDLALSIKLWEHIYITNPKSDSHTNKAIKWLKSNTGYEVSKKAGSASKIREITTPFVSWGNLRDKNYKK